MLVPGWCLPGSGASPHTSLGFPRGLGHAVFPLEHLLSRQCCSLRAARRRDCYSARPYQPLQRKHGHGRCPRPQITPCLWPYAPGIAGLGPWPLSLLGGGVRSAPPPPGVPPLAFATTTAGCTESSDSNPSFGLECIDQMKCFLKFKPKSCS